MLAVIRGPVIFVAVVRVMNGVLRLISGRVDKGVSLAHRVIGQPLSGESIASLAVLVQIVCYDRDEKVKFVQRFVAELSKPIDKLEFEQAWNTDPAVPGEPRAEFVFSGRKVSVVVHSEPWAPWPAARFYRTFSAAIRRLDSVCNVRWL